jgi:hypothetical protein
MVIFGGNLGSDCWSLWLSGLGSLEEMFGNALGCDGRRLVISRRNLKLLGCSCKSGPLAMSNPYIDWHGIRLYFSLKTSVIPQTRRSFIAKEASHLSFVLLDLPGLYIVMMVFRGEFVSTVVIGTSRSCFQGL